MSVNKSRDLKRGRDRKTESVPLPETTPSDDYGKEGTNKTIAQPKADNAPSEELGNTPHIGKTPYTRG